MEAWASIVLAVLTVVASVGATWGAFGARLKRTETDIKEVRENYTDRFDRLERKMEEGFKEMRTSFSRVHTRLDGMLTKEDHDRICKLNQ